jgi:DNA-binding SARP family transcriptional activator/pimeloyl-ACP methyl ester carboxylesterase
MDFRILGPLEVRDGNRELRLRGGKERALLALLLVNANRTLALDRIVDELWAEDVPETAPKMVQIYVSHLRKVLPPDMLRTRPPGYALEVGPDQLDLHRFERLVADAQASLDAGRSEEASTGFRAALDLWRGPALTEFASEPFALAEAARLEELRLHALEGRLEADLLLGRHGDLVGELETLAARYPLREGLRRQHMLALYRSGRHAEALAAYQEARHALAAELGIEPSPALRGLERSILQHDPNLILPTPARAGQTVTPTLRRAKVSYAKSGELSIAYQVTGRGAVDLVLVAGFVSHLEKDWEDPRHARFLERLSSFSRLIRFDKRGTGLSDRPPGVPDLETRMDDVRAVMDTVRCERAVLFGYSEGAPLAILFAATYPERARALVLYGAYAKRLDPDEDYPWASTRDARRAYIAQTQEEWGSEADMKFMCPSADEAMARWWGVRGRAAARPGAAAALLEMNSLIDVRAVLPAIRVPTLVVHRVGDLDAKVEEGRYLAERIPGARFVELAGNDHFVAIDPDEILDVVEPFVAELAGVTPSDDDRALATVLVIQLDEHGARLGPYHDIVRAELARFSGEQGEETGAGSLALFAGPSRAIRCGLAVRERAEQLGLSIRVGLHTGEIERRGSAARGIAIDLAARVAAEAAAGEVLVTATTRDLVAGSGLRFAASGNRYLEAFGEPRRLFLAEP